MRRDYQIQSRLAAYIKEVFSETVCFHRTSDAHNKRMSELIWSTKRY